MLHAHAKMLHATCYTLSMLHAINTTCYMQQCTCYAVLPRVVPPHSCREPCPTPLLTKITRTAHGDVQAGHPTVTPHIHLHTRWSLAQNLQRPPPSNPCPPNRLFGTVQSCSAQVPALFALGDTVTISGHATAPQPSTAEKPKPAEAKMDGLYAYRQDRSYAQTGSDLLDAQQSTIPYITYAQDAKIRIMELKFVLEHRRLNTCTPYHHTAWASSLQHHNLLDRYPTLSYCIQLGFDTGIPKLLHTHTPPNGTSLDEFDEAYEDIERNKFSKERYLGPCSQHEIETLIGPFQTSPLSIIPKPRKTGKFRAVHNFSAPHTPHTHFASINSAIESDNFPCTWGTFNTVAFIISNLPPGSQASVHDVAEAYRTIPITASQWPGLVIRLRGHDRFAINTNNNFGLSSAGGIYRQLADAGTDIFQRAGIGPVSKWVDDHIFFRIQKQHLAEYNGRRMQWHQNILSNGGRRHEGSRIWFRGSTMEDGHPEEFDEDNMSPLRDLSFSPYDPFAYDDTRLTPYQIIWAFLGKLQKLFPSAQWFHTLVLAGIWTQRRLLSLTPKNRSTWPALKNGAIVPLTPWHKFKVFMANFFTRAWWPEKDEHTSPHWRPCLAHPITVLSFHTPHLTALHKTLNGGAGFSTSPTSPGMFLAPSSSTTSKPTPMPAQVWVSASSSATDGGHGNFSQAGRQIAMKSAGLKLSASSSSSERSAILFAAHRNNTSKSLVTTEVSLKAGGKAAAETNPQTRYFAEFMNSKRCGGSQSTHDTLLANKTRLTTHQGAFIPLTPSFFHPSQFPLNSSPSSATSMTNHSSLSRLMNMDLFTNPSQNQPGPSQSASATKPTQSENGRKSNSTLPTTSVFEDQRPAPCLTHSFPHNLITATDQTSTLSSASRSSPIQLTPTLSCKGAPGSMEAASCPASSRHDRQTSQHFRCRPRTDPDSHESRMD